MVEGVLRPFTEVKIQQCQNTPLQVKVLHEKPYYSKSIDLVPLTDILLYMTSLDY